MAIYYMSNWGYTKLIGVETPFITGGGPHSKDLMQPRRFLADRNMAKGKKATVSFFKDVLPREKKKQLAGTLVGFVGVYFFGKIDGIDKGQVYHEWMHQHGLGIRPLDP